MIAGVCPIIGIGIWETGRYHVLLSLCYPIRAGLRLKSNEAI